MKFVSSAYNSQAGELFSAQNRQEAERREILPWRGEALHGLPREALGSHPCSCSRNVAFSDVLVF